MTLVHEALVKYQLFHVGDIKVANYDIAFTKYQLVEPESGWFLLNGAVISQTTYPKLYARFGTTFNIGGEGTGNFRLPDWTLHGSTGQQGPVIPIGKGVSNFTSYAATSGEVNHALVAPTELLSHTHTSSGTLTAGSHGHSGSATADNGGGHTHPYTLGTFSGFALAGSVTVLHGYGTADSGSGGVSHSHSFASLSYTGTTESFTRSGAMSTSGSGTAHNNMMPYDVVGGYLVKHD